MAIVITLWHYPLNYVMEWIRMLKNLPPSKNMFLYSHVTESWILNHWNCSMLFWSELLGIPLAAVYTHFVQGSKLPVWCPPTEAELMFRTTPTDGPAPSQDIRSHCLSAGETHSSLPHNSSEKPGVSTVLNAALAVACLGEEPGSSNPLACISQGCWARERLVTPLKPSTSCLLLIHTPFPLPSPTFQWITAIIHFCQCWMTSTPFYTLLVQALSAWSAVS